MNTKKYKISIEILRLNLGIEFSHYIPKDIFVMSVNLTNFLSFFVLLRLDVTFFTQLCSKNFSSQHPHVYQLEYRRQGFLIWL